MVYIEEIEDKFDGTDPFMGVPLMDSSASLVKDQIREADQPNQGMSVLVEKQMGVPKGSSPTKEETRNMESASQAASEETRNMESASRATSASSEVKVTGMEIVPHRSFPPIEVTGVEIGHRRSYPPLRTFIKNAIKAHKVLFEDSPRKRRNSRVADANPVSVSVDLQATRDNNLNGEASNQASKQDEKQDERRRRSKATSIGRMSLIFKLNPEEETQYALEVEKSAENELSLTDRLRGWEIEQRRRSDGRIDSYYYRNNVLFRSEVEVEDFIIKNICPLNRLMSRKRKENDNNNGAAASSSRASKKPRDSVDNGEVRTENKRPRGRPRKIIQAQPINFAGETVKITRAQPINFAGEAVNITQAQPISFSFAGEAVTQAQPISFAGEAVKITQAQPISQVQPINVAGEAVNFQEQVSSSRASKRPRKTINNEQGTTEIKRPRGRPRKIIQAQPLSFAAQTISFAGETVKIAQPVRFAGEAVKVIQAQPISCFVGEAVKVNALNPVGASVATNVNGKVVNNPAVKVGPLNPVGAAASVATNVNGKVVNNPAVKVGALNPVGASIATNVNGRVVDNPNSELEEAVKVGALNHVGAPIPSKDDSERTLSDDGLLQREQKRLSKNDNGDEAESSLLRSKDADAVVDAEIDGTLDAVVATAKMLARK